MNTRFDTAIALHSSYPVVFTHDVFAPGNLLLADLLPERPARALVYVDAGVLAAWPQLPGRIMAWAAAHPDCLELLGVHPLPGGEAVKNDPAWLDRLGQDFLNARLCRHSYLLAIGGGAVLDAVGFAAATIHRGVRLLRLPTTTLAQNDAGVGVKNGVNRFGIKNFYGAFAPPWAVVNDLDFLGTLDDRTWRSGVAEAFKVGIVKDRRFLEELLTNAERLAQREPRAGEHMLLGTAARHLAHIGSSGDPFEKGSSRPLDFGHWAAHRLESLTGFALLHGEAVAIGMALDLELAVLLGFIAAADARLVQEGLRRAGLPVWHDLLAADLAGVCRGLEEFREHLGGELTLAMPRPLGQGVDLHEADPVLIAKAAARLGHWARGG